MFLQLLEVVLRSTKGLEVVATSQTAKDGIELCQRHLPDLLILDLQLSDGNGVAVARQLIVSKPDAKIILLSAQANTFVCPPDLQPAMHAMIDKTKPYSVLQEQIHLLLESRGYKRVKSHVPKLEELTEREQEIFEMIGKGRTNREISKHFGLSEHTVKTHRKHIATKLNLRGAALIHKAAVASHSPAS